MNATKRKFNTLLNGIGSKPATSLAEKEVNNGSQNATTEQDAQAKKRRISDTLSERSQEPAAPKTVLSTSSATMKHKKSQSLATAPTEPPKYAPWDRTAFLKRLRSFSNLTDWTPKPARVNEVEWAKRGWECKKFERVRCNLCNVEILVKLNKKEVDGKEEPVYIAGNIGRTSVDEDDTDRSLTFDPEEALIDKYAELIINSHDEDCLWRKRGCDDTIFKLPLNHAPTTLHLLRERYEELCARKDTLPYSFNIKTPPGFDLDLILSYLPANFFTPLPTSSSEITPTTINRVAFTMALFGWQGHSHGRLGPQLGSVSCEACFRVLGLWLFKSKKVNESGEEVTPAVVPGLDVVMEHRTYCPWRNPESQNGTQATTKSSSALAGWEVILRVLKNEHRLRTGSAPSPPAKPRATRDSAEVVSQTSDDIDDDTAKSIRDEKDKERWARLRRVKSLFETKGKRLQREEKRKSRAE